MTTGLDLSLELLLDEIRTEVEDTGYLTGRRTLDSRVLESLRQVPRHAFVPAEHQSRAYGNHPLPIGHGQTISQPYVVALMTDLIRPKASDVVLEVGTGSGYQAAVLSSLVHWVYSLEIVAELAKTARERLQRLGYANVEVCAGNGHFGWPEHAPYDAIMVTAAATNIPPTLIDQLKPGGVLVIPIGGPYMGQRLTVVHKHPDGRLDEKSVLPVAFVPMTGSPEHLL